MHEIFQPVALDTVGRGKLLERWLGRYDDGNGSGSVISGINTDIRNNGGGTVDGLKLSSMLVLELLYRV